MDVGLAQVLDMESEECSKKTPQSEKKNGEDLQREMGRGNVENRREPRLRDDRGGDDGRQN